MLNILAGTREDLMLHSVEIELGVIVTLFAYPILDIGKNLAADYQNAIK